MKSTPAMYADNSTQAHFLQWAWGQGTWPSVTSYGLSSFMDAAGFTPTGNISVPGAGTVDAFVTTGTDGTSTTSFTTPSFNTATGDLMVLYIYWYYNSSQSVSTVSDLGGNSWTHINTWTSGTNAVSAYYVQGATAHSSNTVTVVFTAAVTYAGIAVYDVVGMQTSGAYDNSVAAFATSDVTTLTPVISTSNANDLIFGFTVSNASTPVISFPTGWTESAAFPSTGQFVQAAYEAFTTTQTNLAVTSTLSPSATGIAVLLAFKELVNSTPIGDGQVVFNNVTFNVTSTQSSGSVATYGFSGLSGGYLRTGMYIASVSGTTNGSGAFNITIPTEVVVVTGVTYTTTTSGTFTTYWTGGTYSSQPESGTGQVNATCSTYWLTSTQTLPANNSSIGSTSSAAYQTLFRGYWLSTTAYNLGDVVTYVSSGTGTSAVVGTFVCIDANTGNAPPSTNAPTTYWAIYNYEVWETGDSALPTYVQGNSQSQSVTFNPLGYDSPNTSGNTLIVFGRFTGGSGTPTITDTAGNTWTELYSVANGSDVNVIWVAYTAVGTTTTNYVTLAQPTQSALQMAIAEYSGVSSIYVPLDQQAYATGTSTAANSGNVTTTQANELILGFVSNSTTNGLTITPGGGFTGRITVNGNTFLEDQTVSVAGTYAASATLSSSVPWFCAVVTLKGTQLPPYYFKFEYGNISTNCPSVNFQIGTSITATGSLSASGLRGYRETLGYTSATTNSTTQYETDFYADATNGLAGGKFACIMFRTSTNSQSWFFGWERSKNNFGVDTNLYMTYVIGEPPSPKWIQSSVFASGGTNYGQRVTNGAFAICQQSTTTLQVGNNVAVSPVFPSVGYFGNPMTILLGLNIADTNEGVVFSAQVYGGTHSYLMSKGGSVLWGEYFASNGSPDSGFAMRWE